MAAAHDCREFVRPVPPIGPRIEPADGTVQAVSLMKTTRIYPLSQPRTHRRPSFVNGSHQEIDTIFSDSGHTSPIWPG